MSTFIKMQQKPKLKINKFEQLIMCGRKKIYDTQSQADFVGSSYLHRSYQCYYCSKWHLTKG